MTKVDSVESNFNDDNSENVNQSNQTKQPIISEELVYNSNKSMATGKLLGYLILHIEFSKLRCK